MVRCEWLSLLAWGKWSRRPLLVRSGCDQAVIVSFGFEKTRGDPYGLNKMPIGIGDVRMRVPLDCPEAPFVKRHESLQRNVITSGPQPKRGLRSFRLVALVVKGYKVCWPAFISALAGLVLALVFVPVQNTLPGVPKVFFPGKLTCQPRWRFRSYA